MKCKSIYKGPGTKEVETEYPRASLSRDRAGNEEATWNSPEPAAYSTACSSSFLEGRLPPGQPQPILPFYLLRKEWAQLPAFPTAHPAPGLGPPCAPGGVLISTPGKPGFLRQRQRLRRPR